MNLCDTVIFVNAFVKIDRSLISKCNLPVKLIILDTKNMQIMRIAALSGRLPDKKRYSQISSNRQKHMTDQ